MATILVITHYNVPQAVNTEENVFKEYLNVCLDFLLVIPRKFNSVNSGDIEGWRQGPLFTILKLTD